MPYCASARAARTCPGVAERAQAGNPWRCWPQRSAPECGGLHCCLLRMMQISALLRIGGDSNHRRDCFSKRGTSHVQPGLERSKVRHCASLCWPRCHLDCCLGFFFRKRSQSARLSLLLWCYGQTRPFLTLPGCTGAGPVCTAPDPQTRAPRRLAHLAI